MMMFYNEDDVLKIQQDKENARDDDRAKLDDLREKYYGLAMAGDVAAVAAFTKVCERRAKLLGLDLR